MNLLVIKLGGSTIHDVSREFFQSLKDLKASGYKMVFVHGGGPDINSMLDTFEIPVEFNEGLRKTTPEVFEIVEMVLSGKTNRLLVEMLEQNGISAIGLNGTDVKLLEAELINEEKWGLVGQISNVNTELLRSLLEKNLSPVLTPLAVTENGQKVNVNADMAAGAVAKAMKAQSCIFVTDVKGVLNGKDLIPVLNEDEAKTLMESQVISGGMIPKVKTALSVLQTGIKNVMIVSGKDYFFKNGTMIGTTFCKGEKIKL
ncbi:acetylglutamate kinase [Peribacillus tepidiphilus]|uniref:acetylglutamate kinase n=1 Tax=Peribacillus tepidiphilus TaxID=2652445 RepID=UPI001290A249|nr:acetylglutamate kinase [Peribacillus tepidiphilus]